MARTKKPKCQCAARLREPHEPQSNLARGGGPKDWKRAGVRRGWKYWRSSVRLCRRVAELRVTVRSRETERITRRRVAAAVEGEREMLMCRECFDREQREHPDDILKSETIAR